MGRDLALRTHGEIISLDSMKVYRRMNVGTGKPTPEEQRDIPHHLIDVVEPSEAFSVAQFVSLTERAIGDIHGRGRPIYIVGGTPLYLKALTEGLFQGPGADPDVRARLQDIAATQGQEVLHEHLRRVDPSAARRIHPRDLRRIVRALEVHELTGETISALQTQWDQGPAKYDCVLIGIRRTLEDQNSRTNERVRRMIQAGLVEEVAALLSEPSPLSKAARQALGYAEIIQHLAGELSLADAIEMIKINTRQFAKAQRTWFKRFPATHWIDLSPNSPMEDVVEKMSAIRQAADGRNQLERRVPG